MKKLFDREPVWFAVLWIGIYVVLFSAADALSEHIGIPKLITAAAGAAMSVCLYGFIRRHGLSRDMGLCRWQKPWRQDLYFAPIIAVAGVNLWNGAALHVPAWETVWFVVSMCFVGFLEEIIFRGLLFSAMAKSSVKWAFIVASVTFGMGHIVNLLSGAPLVGTLLQLVYAAAMGFCYTAVFYVSGSLVPCILSHAVTNALSVFAVPASGRADVITAAVLTLAGLGYGWWLLRTMGPVHGNAQERKNA